MRCRIYEYFRNNRGLGHTEAAAAGAKNSEAILVTLDHQEAKRIAKQYKIDCISIDALAKIPRPRAVIFDNQLIVKEFEDMMKLLGEKQDLIMEISSRRPEVIQEANEALRRRK